MLRLWLWVWAAWAAWAAGGCGANHCREASLCCPGRDSSCVVQQPHQHALADGAADKPCYCDHACLKLGDCCPDFRETCGVSDCTVSEWGAWSACDTGCGAGSMQRARRVLAQPARGGRRCPALLQRRACLAHHACPPDSDVPLQDESAMILPGSLSVSRHSNDTVDIRKNLRLRNPDDPESNAHREYCVQFEVTKVSKACHLDSEYKALREGGTVCVRCEAAALRRAAPPAPPAPPAWRCGGHGVPGRATRFHALAAPHCRGRWTRAGAADASCCAAAHAHAPDFIFV